MNRPLPAPAASAPSDEPDALAQASQAFLTAVPQVSAEQAAALAREAYGIEGQAQPLSGERDRNFLIRSPDGSAVTLKFISAAESLAETEMQIAVLKHLAGRCAVPVPLHHPLRQPASAQGSASADWLEWRSPEGELLRVRCYSFLDGKAGSDLQRDASAWQVWGLAIAQLHGALADFAHPATERPFLWDARRAPLLRPWLEVVEDAQLRAQIAAFWTAFEQRLAQLGPQLPTQTIHNDLSPSNLLASDDGLGIAGVLDFGDMLRAPRVADLAIAASYQMPLTDAPDAALAAMLAGYESLLPLTAAEHALLPDLILARLTQRMVITAWRARLYPENRVYILRSQATATALFSRMVGDWLQRHGALPNPCADRSAAAPTAA
ncbi:phosphotransferase [Comamonas sp. JUb58]|uniref:phosphotransferase n=1 Tax=Comamonas sp. JUb58 TaxID=2485114 RepID=UPI0010615DBE|nr:phosphotransferase [Comamonas sp. JUb58]TDS78690.1 Ser/Thr protein kinase RdoA (MazF antagonist) [Comamonas sp. JUb58]